MKLVLVLVLVLVLGLSGVGCSAGHDTRMESLLNDSRSLHVAEVSSATEAELATSPTLDLVTTLAVQRNPDVLVALERWAQFLERAPQKWAAPNPFVGYSYASMFKMHELGSGLTIPFPSKLAAEANAALAEARAAGADYRESETRIRAEAARGYANLWLAGRQLAIVDENLVLLARFIEIAEAKLKAGTASLADTLRAQVERDGLRAERATLVREVDIARSALNVLLDRSPDAPLGPLAPLADPAVPLTGAPLVEEALGRRPALLAANARVEAAEHMLARAEREWLPDFQVGGAYVYDAGTYSNFFQAGGGISLPLFFGPIRAKIREAEAAERGSRAELRAMRNRVLDEVRAASLRVDAARERWEILTKDALPRSEAALRASETAYVAKQIEFSALVDAERQLLSKKLERERALAEHAIALAELHRALGRGTTGSASRTE